MSAASQAYFAGSLLAVGVFILAAAFLARPFESVLGDLLGSPRRARFFQRALLALLAAATLAGSLLPTGWIDPEAASPAALAGNAARQLLGAGGSLLAGLGLVATLLLKHILEYERRRRATTRPPLH